MVQETFSNALQRNALSQPDRIAIKYGSRSRSYFDLYSIAVYYRDAWAEMGIGPGDKVAILARKGIESVQAMVSTMLLGACYVPIDWRNPGERISKIMSDCKPKLLIGKKTDIKALQLSGQLSPRQEILVFEDMVNNSGMENTAERILRELNDEVVADNPAYCLYTSGSTGDPKGVLISCHAFHHFVDKMNQWLNVNTSSSCLNTSPFFFDVSIADSMLPLYYGATVHITGDIFSPPAVMQLIRTERVTHFCAVSSLLTLIASEIKEGEILSDLNTIMSGAEVLDPDSINTILKAAPQAKIINGYGPTEATCVCIAKSFNSEDARKGFSEFAIGLPLQGMRAELLNADGKLVVGAGDGELLVSGPQLMLGYLNDDITTGMKIWEHEGKRFYRTGDNCRRDEGGIYYFLGRLDDEVKVSGYRFHLNEVRACLKSCDAIKDVAVLVMTEEEKKKLAAVLVPKLPADESLLKKVEEHAKRLLPSYMIPTKWSVLSILPRTATGKISKTQLLEEIVK